MSAAPTVKLSLNSANVFPGEAITGTLTFSNDASDPSNPDSTGYGPLVGIDLGANADNLTLGALSYLGQTLTIHYGQFDSSGNFTVPGTASNPGGAVVLTGTAGDKVAYFTLPFGSFTAGQTAVSLPITINVPSSVSVGTPISLTPIGVFEYGDSATGNTPIVTSGATSSASASILTINTVYSSTGELVTGPSSTATWQVFGNLLTGYSLNNFTLSDPLPDTAIPTTVTITASATQSWTYTYNPATGTLSSTDAGAPPFVAYAATATTTGPWVTFNLATNTIEANFGNIHGAATSATSDNGPAISATFYIPGQPVVTSGSGSATGTGDLTVTDQLPAGATANSFTVTETEPNGNTVTYYYSYDAATNQVFLAGTSIPATAPFAPAIDATPGVTGNQFVTYDQATGLITADFGAGLPAGTIGHIDAAWTNGPGLPNGEVSQTVAANQSVHNLTLTDTLTGGSTFNTITVSDGSNTYTYTVDSSGKLTEVGSGGPGVGDGTGDTTNKIWYNKTTNTVTVNFGNVTTSSNSNTWSVTTSTSSSTVTGSGGGSSTHSTSGSPAASGVSSGQGSVPPGTVSTPTTGPNAPGANAVTAAPMTLVKTASPVVAGNGTTDVPGDDIQYTITGKLSNYVDVNNVTVSDTLGDGQTYDSSVTPTLVVYSDGTEIYSGAITPNGTPVQNTTTGQTALTFDVSAALQAAYTTTSGAQGSKTGDINGGDAVNDLPATGPLGNTTFQIVYNSTISPTFVSGQAVTQDIVQGDSIGNVANASATTVGTNVQLTANASASTTLPVGSVQKSVYAVGGTLVSSGGVPEAGGLPMIQAGNTVTYELQYTIPAGTADNVVLTDYLPLPIFNVLDPNGASAGSYSFNATPGEDTIAGTVSFLDPTTGTPLAGVTPTLTAIAGTNALQIGLGTIDSTQSYTFDVLVTQTAEDQPFVNGLQLTNEVTSTQDTSTGKITTGSSIAQVVLAQPEINVIKGVTGISHAGTTGATEVLTGSLVGDFSNGVLKSGDVITDSNVGALNVAAPGFGATGAQAGDQVTYVIAVQNSGNSTAYNTVVKDSLPSVIAAGSVTGVTATDGAGNAIQLFDPNTLNPLSAAQAAADLFNGTGVDIASIGADNGTAPSTGSDIVLLDYTATLGANTPEPQVTETNTATVTQYQGVNGGTNFANGPSPGNLTSSVAVQTALPTEKKNVTSTSESVTAADNVTVRAGEQVTYTVVTTLDAGSYGSVDLTDSLPNNGAQSLSFVSAQITAVGAGITSANGAPAAGLVGTTISSSGITLNNVVVADNSQAGDDTITYTITALANATQSNLNKGAPDTVLTNTANVAATAPGSTTPVNAQDQANVDLLTPKVTVTKTVENVTQGGGYKSTITGVMANDEVQYKLAVTDASTAATAYNVTITDNLATQIGTGINVDASSLQVYNGTTLITPTTASITNGVLTVVLPEVDAGANYSITFDGTVNTTDAFDASYLNKANFTDQTLPSTDTQGTQQTYNGTSSTANVTLAYPTTTKTLASVSDLTLNAANGTTGDRIEAGDVATYTVTVTVPEGTSTDLDLKDTLPTGLSYVANSAVITNVGTGLTSSTGGALTLTESAISGGVQFDLGAVKATQPSTVTISYQALVSNTATAGQTLENTISTVTAGKTVGTQATANVAVVAPTVNIVKSSHEDAATIAGTSSGYLQDYTITVTPTNNVPAYDVTISDIVPTTETITGPVQVTEIINGVKTTSTITPVGNTITLPDQQTLNGQGFYGPASSIEIDYQTLLNNGSHVGDAISNKAVVTEYTAPGTDNGAAVSANSTASFNVPAGSLSGIVFQDFNDNGVKDTASGLTDNAIAGATVTLYSATTHAPVVIGGKVDTTATDSNGAYSFTGLDQGSYYVQITDSGYAGYSPIGTNANAAIDSIVDATGTTAAVNVYAGENTPNQNAGLYKLGSLSGEVFFDTNENGQMDNGETGIGTVKVELFNNGTDTGISTTAQLTSTASGTVGDYQFTGLIPGTYSVEVIPSADQIITKIPTSPTATVYNHADTAGDIQNIQVYSGTDTGHNDAGVAAPGEIKAFVFFDGQCSGTYHVGDAGIAGVTVLLLDSSGNKVASTTTDIHGGYDFKDLASGTYTVQVVAPAGMDFSDVEHASGNPLLDSDVNASGLTDTLTVAPGGLVQSANAGLEFNGNFNGATPIQLSQGQQYASFTGGQVIVGPGDNNVHTGSPGNNVVVLDGNNNIIELGLNASSNEDIGTSCGTLQAQTQSAANGFLFAGGTGSSYLDGGSGNAYLMGGLGANQVYSGSGNNTIIAGGNGSLITTGGLSTTIYYEKGDGLLTIDNGLRASVDTLTVYGYSSGSGVIKLVNGIQELVLSSTDIIQFVGPTQLGNGTAVNGNGLTFVDSITAAPIEELSFNTQDLPQFTTPGGTVAAAPAPVTTPVPVAPITLPPAGTVPVVTTPAPQPVATPPVITVAPATPGVTTLIETSSVQGLNVGAGITALQLFGYNNDVTDTNGGLTVTGDDGNSTFHLSGGNNDLVATGQGDTIVMGGANNTVQGNLGGSTITLTGNGTVDTYGYTNTITIGDGQSFIGGVAGQSTITVGTAGGTNGGTIQAAGNDNLITVNTGSGSWAITAGNGSDTVNITGGTDQVTLAGWSNHVSVTTGHAIVGGAAGDDIYSVLALGPIGSSVVSMDVAGFSAAQGDVLNVHGALQAGGFTAANLLLTQNGVDTVVSVGTSAGSYLLADLHNTQASSLQIGHSLVV